MKVTDEMAIIPLKAWEEFPRIAAETYNTLNINCMKAALEAVFAMQGNDKKAIKDFVDMMEQRTFKQGFASEMLEAIKDSHEFQALKASISSVSEDKPNRDICKCSPEDRGVGCGSVGSPDIRCDRCAKLHPLYLDEQPTDTQDNDGWRGCKSNEPVYYKREDGTIILQG